jgi:hypothetical protein
MNKQAVTLIGWGGFPVGMLPDTEYESEEFRFIEISISKETKRDE